MLSKFRINRAALFLGVLGLLTLPREVWGQKRVFAKVEPNADALNGSAEVYNAATGGFSNTPGSLATAREAETANLLPNGMVLLAGGFNGGYLGTAELFDPSTGAFRAPAGAMVTARSSHRAVLLQNGKVLVAGGFNGNFLSAAELYDYSTQVFTSTGAMTAARESFSATVLASGKALIAGGFNGSYLQSAEIYDTVAGTFAATGSMMTAREGHSATLLPGGKVLIAGGFNGSYLNTAELFDPATGSFTATGSMAGARSEHSATLLGNGKVLIAGGFDGASLGTAEIFDPATGKFSSAGEMSTSRRGHSATLLPNGKVLIAGGFNGSILASAEVFDPASGGFAVTGSMTAPRQLHAAVPLSDGNVLISGGRRSKLLIFDVNLLTTDNISPDIVFSPDSTRGFVSYTGSGTVVCFSAVTGEILKRIETGGKPVFATLLPDGQTLAVVSALDNRIFLIGTDTLELRSTFTFSGALFGFGSRLTLSPDGSFGYVSSTGTGEVIKFSMSSGGESGRLKGLQAPAQITVSPDGTVLLVVDTVAEELVFADTSTLARKNTLKPRDKQPTADFTIFNKAVLSPDGSSGIIATRVANTAFIFKTDTAEIVDTETIGALPGFTGLTPDGQYWVILNQTSLWRALVTDPAAAHEEQQMVQGDPIGSANIVFSPDSRYAFYASSANDLFFQHDLNTTAVVGRMPVGDGPNGSLDQPSSAAITPDGKTIAVLNFERNDIELMADVTMLDGAKFISTANQFTGLSLVSLSPSPATITLLALDNYGQPIAESGVQNPKQLVLPPNGQISQTVSEIFNFDPSKEHIGWLSVSSDQPQVAGYLAIGEIQPTWFGFFLNRLDGVPLFRERLYDWVVPEVVTPSGGSIELNFVNPNYNQGTYDVARYSTDGSLLETRNTNTAYPTNRQTQIFADVFGQPNQGRVVLAGGQGTSATLNTVESFDPKGGTFTATGSMSEARTAHTATLLLNGKILVTGGKGDSGLLSSAEIYDPAAGSFTAAAGQMSIERQRHTATLLPSGSVLIVGGQSSTSVNDSAELYDPATGTFSLTSGRLAAPRDSHTATLLPNGKVLIAGGIDGDNVTSTAELYDPATGSFTPTGSMGIARAFHTATLLPNGRVLIVGGFNGNYLDSAEIYDYATGTFAAGGRMNIARSEHTAVLLAAGKVLIAGGTNGNGAALNTAETYDPSLQTFLFTTGTMVSQRKSAVALLLSDGRVFIAGGSDGASALNTVETYSPDDDRFHGQTAMSAARAGFTATLLGGGKDGYLRMTSRPGLFLTELYGGSLSSAAVNGIDLGKSSGVTRLYAPQFAMVPGFKTLLNLINGNTDRDAEVTLTLHAPDGRVIGNPVTRTLLRNAQIKDDLAAIFLGDPALQNVTGWVGIESTIDHLVGTVSFTNDAESFLTSFELSGVPLTGFLFPLAAEDDVFQTGIALLNANDQAAAVTMEVWGPGGTLDRSTTLTFPPGTRTARYLREYFPDLSPHFFGNIRIRSDRPLHACAILSDRNLNFLATVPSMAFP